MFIYFSCDIFNMNSNGPLKYFSMFTGVGGFEIGIQQAFNTLRDAREGTHIQEDSADNNDSERWRSHPVCVGYSEINKYACAVLKHQYPKIKNYGNATKINAEILPDFDMLVGGFPCQAFSVAGKREGFNDTRGTLFFDVARIAQQKQPRFLVLENVKGLLSHDKGKTFFTIVSTLDELGYDVEWQVLNSKNHGVPQNRERVFIVGRFRGTGGRKIFPFGTENVEDTRKIKRKGNVNPSGNGMNGEVYHDKGVSPTLSTNKGEGTKICRSVLTPDRANKRQNGRRVKDSEEPSFTITKTDRHGVMMCVPEATKKGYAEARPGQSINLANISSATRRGRVSDLANTLDTGMQQHTITNTRIRRLTPTECERLQGFPDGWTRHGIFDGEVKEISDTQRYKMMGNAVTTNVVRDIMIEMFNEPTHPDIS